jgi:hypothetical protein
MAQTMATSTVTGKVTADGAPLPGVRVVATSPKLQGQRGTVTDANGVYLLPFLPPGEYELTFEMDKMQTRKEKMTLTGDMTDTVNAELQLAAVSEEIIVTADKQMTAPIEATAVSMNIKQDLVNVLPVGRTFEAVTLLAPGVNAGGPNDNIIISGAMSYDSLYLVNGMIINENGRQRVLWEPPRHPQKRELDGADGADGRPGGQDQPDLRGHLRRGDLAR